MTLKITRAQIEADERLHRQRMNQHEHNSHVGTITRAKAFLKGVKNSSTITGVTQAHLIDAEQSLILALRSLRIRRNADGSVVKVNFKKDHG